MRGPRSGYSLIEVLIAFAVMALVLTAILPGQTRLLSRAASKEHRLLAMDWSASHIEALGLTDPIPLGLQTAEWNDWTLELLVEQAPGQEIESVYSVRATVLDGQNNLLTETETIRGMP